MTLEVKVYNKTEVVSITFEDPVARIMEYGTLTQAPQPFVRPALEEVKKDVPRLVRKGGIHEVAEAIVEKAREKLKIIGKEKVGEKVTIKEVPK